MAVYISIICFLIYLGVLFVLQKKGKSFKIITKRTNTKKKVTYKSSNKKYVKVSAAGKVTAKKYTKKTVTITVKAGTLKKTFKVKVTR